MLLVIKFDTEFNFGTEDKFNSAMLVHEIVTMALYMARSSLIYWLCQILKLISVYIATCQIAELSLLWLISCRMSLLQKKASYAS